MVENLPLGSLAQIFVKQRFDNISKMQRVQCPTLIVHGELDTLVPRSQGEALAGSLGSLAAARRVARLHVCPQMGHDITELNEQVLNPVKGFLKEIAVFHEGNPRPKPFGNLFNLN